MKMKKDTDLFSQTLEFWQSLGINVIIDIKDKNEKK